MFKPWAVTSQIVSVVGICLFSTGSLGSTADESRAQFVAMGLLVYGCIACWAFSHPSMPTFFWWAYLSASCTGFLLYAFWEDSVNVATKVLGETKSMLPQALSFVCS